MSPRWTRRSRQAYSVAAHSKQFEPATTRIAALRARPRPDARIGAPLNDGAIAERLRWVGSRLDSIEAWIQHVPLEGRPERGTLHVRAPLEREPIGLGDDQ
jgi:hypothetical protein